MNSNFMTLNYKISDVVRGEVKSIDHNVDCDSSINLQAHGVHLLNSEKFVY